MADKPKLPAPSTAGGQVRRGSRARTELLLRAAQRLPKAALHDPVEDWKRLALSAARRTPEPHAKRWLLRKLLALPVIASVIAAWEARRESRDRHWKQLAWTAIGGRDPFLAHGAIAHLQADAIDLHLIASYLHSCNRRGEALELLTHARASGHRCRETSRLLIDLLFRRGENDAVRRVASADAALLSHDEQQAIEAALRVDNDV
jgi:hypothetical protein